MGPTAGPDASEKRGIYLFAPPKFSHSKLRTGILRHVLLLPTVIRGVRIRHFKVTPLRLWRIRIKEIWYKQYESSRNHYCRVLESVLLYVCLVNANWLQHVWRTEERAVHKANVRVCALVSTRFQLPVWRCKVGIMGQIFFFMIWP